jgi:hypothetical protein
MTESPEELAAVEQLLAESDALRGWLARLDQAPGGAADAVRERVRNDYQQRLDQITAGLRAHGDVIAAKLHDDRTEHADLQARAASARDALAEAELRHAVGEYDGQRFESERRKHGSDIETFQLSLDAAAERIARLEEIQALVQRAPRGFAIEIDPAASDVVTPELPAFALADADMVTIGDLAPDADEELAVFDGSAAEQAEPKMPGAAAAPVPDTGPLSFRPSGNGAEAFRPPIVPSARPRPFESMPPLGIPAADLPPRFLRPGERLGGHPAPPASMPATPIGTPAAAIVGEMRAPDASAAPVGRTLRCGECGAMNRPLEWYCEKCGAELTAV